MVFFQDAPDVEVKYLDDVVICSSDANPAATYDIVVNGTDQYIPTCSCTLPLEVDYDTHIRCNATNVVGAGMADTVAMPGRSK